MPTRCKDCRYWREAAESGARSGAGCWCSNSQSPFFQVYTYPHEGCDVGEDKRKRAPWWMRALVKLLGKA